MSCHDPLDSPSTVDLGPVSGGAVYIMVCGLLFLISSCRPHSLDHAGMAYPSRIEELAVRNLPADSIVESQTRGRKVYEHYCQICHGEQGQGDGFNSTNLAVSPRDFGSDEFWQTATDASLRSAISDGGKSVGKSVLMPAWGKTLIDEQIRDVIAFLRTVPEMIKQQGESDDASID